MSCRPEPPSRKGSFWPVELLVEHEMWGRLAGAKVYTESGSMGSYCTWLSEAGSTSKSWVNTALHAPLLLGLLPLLHCFHCWLYYCQVWIHPARSPLVWRWPSGEGDFGTPVLWQISKVLVVLPCSSNFCFVLLLYCGRERGKKTTTVHSCSWSLYVLPCFWSWCSLLLHAFSLF